MEESSHPTKEYAMRLATLSAHGRNLKANGFIPRDFPEVVGVRAAKAEDQVHPKYPFVAEDYDGNGVVALKAEDFTWLA